MEGRRTSCSTATAVAEDAKVTMEGAAATPNRAMEGATAGEAAGSTSRGRGGVHGLRRPGAPQATPPPEREKREAARPPGWRWTTLSLGEALPPWRAAITAVWMKQPRPGVAPKRAAGGTGVGGAATRDGVIRGGGCGRQRGWRGQEIEKKRERERGRRKRQG